MKQEARYVILNLSRIKYGKRVRYWLLVTNPPANAPTTHENNAKDNQKYTATWIRWWSPTQLLTGRSET